jgi:hypothetical protein
MKNNFSFKLKELLLKKRLSNSAFARIIGVKSQSTVAKFPLPLVIVKNDPNIARLENEVALLAKTIVNLITDKY